MIVVVCIGLFVLAAISAGISLCDSALRGMATYKRLAAAKKQSREIVSLPRTAIVKTPMFERDISVVSAGTDFRKVERPAMIRSRWFSDPCSLRAAA